MEDPVSETQPQAETPQAERHERPPFSDEPIQYDESLLIMVKGKVQQPKQPDHTESRLLISKLQVEISKRSERIKEIKTIEEELRGNAKGAFSGNKEVLGKLKELRDQRGTILRQKNAIRDELRNCDGTRDAVRAEMRSIRDKNRNIKNIEKIETDLRDAEFKLEHESLPEQEEKRLQALVQQLNQARPLARKYVEYEQRLKDSEGERASILERLKDSDKVIAALDEQIKEASGVLDESKAKADQHYADLPTLQVEKKENYEIMVALRAKIDEMRKKNDDEYQEYIKRDRAYRAYSREQRRVKNAERAKEREERYRSRDEDQKAAEGELGLEPYHAEVFTCEQLLVYLRGFVATKEEVAQEVKQVEIPAGMKAFKKQEVVDDMFSGVPKKQQQSKGGKAPAVAAPKPAEAAKPKVQKLNHTLDMLKTFLQLKVEPPTTTSGIPATIEKVEERKQEYLKLREDAKNAPPPAANGNHHSNGKAAQAADDEPSTSAAPQQEEEEEQAPAPSSAKAEESDAAFEDAPAPAEAPEPVKEEAPPKPAGDGVDVKLQVSGDKVSLSVTAA